MSDDVVDKVGTVDIVHDSSVERTWLLKVHCKIKLNHIISLDENMDKLTFSDFAQIPVRATNPFLVISLAFSVSGSTVGRTLMPEVCQGDDGALIVGTSTLVVDGHEAVALEVGDRNNGLVNRNLRVVDTKSVTVGVRVGEKTGLQDRIARRLKVGDRVGGREGSLSRISVRPSLVSVVRANQPVQPPRSSFEHFRSTRTCRRDARGNPCETRSW